MPTPTIRLAVVPTLLFILCLPMIFSACVPDPGPQLESGKETGIEPEWEATEENPVSPATKVIGPNGETAAVEIIYQNPLTPEQQSEGWLSLFDGFSLFGWESNNEEVDWHVADGVITASQGPNGLLLTTVPFADYELVCEYRMEVGANSGLFLRTPFPSGNISTDCYEVNIADEHPDGFLTGSLVKRAKTAIEVPNNYDWNTFRIVVNGDNIEIELNSVPILSYNAEGKINPLGRIGLQKNFGKIEFRKIIVRPLNLTNLFNGTDLTGWRLVPDSKSEFHVEEETIRATNGPGFLETEQTFQDFIFQADAKTHAAFLNSGFFFRAEPGTAEAPSNGYEFQIHNGFEGSRSFPDNAGTGAIFRRVDARYVVADDEQWFRSTLIAFGPRICCWVNGYHVVDWVDTREADPNPRRGLRLDAGHISLQGHDPTTDISFRNLQVVEFPALSAEATSDQQQ